MKPEQSRAPNYPDTSSEVVLDAFSAGYANARFEDSILFHGNDMQVLWKSYDLDCKETYTLRKIGLSEATPAQTDGFQLSRWSLEFEVSSKTLVIDAGLQNVTRYDGEFLVEASYLDVADVYAACINLDYHQEERQRQGWNPAIDYYLQGKGYFSDRERD